MQYPSNGLRAVCGHLWQRLCEMWPGHVFTYLLLHTVSSFILSVFTFTSVYVNLTCIKPDSLSLSLNSATSPSLDPELSLLSSRLGLAPVVAWGWGSVGRERDEGWRQPVIASLNNPLHLLSQPRVPAPCVSPTTTYHLPCLAHTPPERESSQTHSHTPHALAFKDTHNREASPDKGCLSVSFSKRSV